MKKLLITTSLVFLLFLGLKAQYGLHYGAGFGASLNNLQNGFKSIGTTAPGVQAQLFVDYGFNRDFSIESGVNYHFNRITNLSPGQVFFSPLVVQNDIYTLERLNTNLILHQIEVPLLFIYKVSQFRVFAGASFNYTMAASAYSDYYAYNSTLDKNFPKKVLENVVGNFEPYDVAVHLGVQKKIGNIAFYAEAKGGVLEISKLNSLALDNGYNYSFRTFSFVIGGKYYLSSLFSSASNATE